MPNSTLSRNIAELEKAIGLRLLHRSTRKVELTAAGEVYFKRCQSIVAEALSTHQALRDGSERPVGTLRVSTTSSFAVAYLAPLVSGFAAAYPLIRFDIDVSSRRVDLQSEPFDLAIRLGPLPVTPSSLVVRQIAVLPRYLYASPLYLRHAPPLDHASDLAAHVVRATPASAGYLALDHVVRRGDETVRVQADARFLTNSADMSRAMAAFGNCIVELDPLMARFDVAAGRLQRVLPEWQLDPIQVHAITDTRHLPARTNLFIACLKEHLERQ
jgi:DNA-binding transcriptional LysR family regulator